MVDKEVSKFKRKQRLRMLWKYYKVGKWDVVAHTVTEDEKRALRMYYGVQI